MHRLPVDADAFVAESQSSEVAEAGQRSFDHVTQLAKAAAVGLARPRREEAVEVQREHQRDHLLRAVGAVAEDRVCVAAWSATRALHRRPRVEQCRQLRFIAHVRGRGLHDQRHAIGIAQDVAFASLFAAIRRVRAGVDPPFTARTD